MEDFGAVVNELYGMIDELGGGVVTMTAVLMLIMGLVNCFFGYKVFRVMVSIAVGAIFAAIGFAIGTAVGEGEAVAIVLAVAFFALGAWLGFKLYKVGVFLYIWLMATAILMVLFAGLFDSDSSAVIVAAVVLGIVVAIVGVKLLKPVVIVMTGISGGLNTGMAIGMLTGKPGSSVYVVVGAVLAVAGILAQFYMEKKKPAVAAAGGQAQGSAKNATAPAANAWTPTGPTAPVTQATPVTQAATANPTVQAAPVTQAAPAAPANGGSAGVKTRFCGSCGAKLKETDTFCPNCGKKTS